MVIKKRTEGGWETLEHPAVGEAMLANKELIGARRWGMAALYYRAGLSQQEIADVFGMSRQGVAGQLTRAMRLVAWAKTRRK